MSIINFILIFYMQRATESHSPNESSSNKIYTLTQTQYDIAMVLDLELAILKSVMYSQYER